MQAIQTKYVGPTNTSGGKVIATSQAGTSGHAWNHAEGVDDNHRAAARAHAEKFGWKGEMVSGWLKDETCVHVFTGRK